MIVFIRSSVFIIGQNLVLKTWQLVINLSSFKSHNGRKI
ncbi:hypothetical protein AO380_1511 [Moraxella catarrhalis]|nr:hypothetical protein AO380_1511 [Moraxella catarrhalis]